jgi:uncharacterized membrane protein AbrB (regulator of aidB expression)
MKEVASVMKTSVGQESVSSLRMNDLKNYKSHWVFGCQIVLIYIVIITCIINLSIGNGESNLWTALLSSCLGYILPAPSIKNIKKSNINGVDSI